MVWCVEAVMMLLMRDVALDDGDEDGSGGR